MKNHKSVYILSVEAKDLYIANHLVSDRKTDTYKIIGYSTKNKNGSYNLKKFVNALDYSLDLIKLREVDRKVFRNKKFSFHNENLKEFTHKVINVNFTYSNKEYNKFGSNMYVKNGYLPRELEFKDGVCVINGELRGIILNTEVENSLSNDVLGDYFQYNDKRKTYEHLIVKKEDKLSRTKEYQKKIKTLHSVQVIKNDLYTNGFYCNGIKYVRYKRSAGSSRMGKCLFIEEALYNKMHQYDLCGLDIRQGDIIDLAAFESYIALTLSSIIDTIYIKKENILVIDDYESAFIDNVIAVRNQHGKLIAKNENVEIKNSIWDGQSLIDKSLMETYSDKGMILLRNRFFKSCCFNCNIQTFFEDNAITSINQLSGFTLAKDIKDIKFITTPNSIKYLKFDTLKKWFENIDETFGIVKYEKPTPYFDGNLVQSHYQLLNTLQFDYNTMKNFLEPTINFMKSLRDDLDVVKYYINYPLTEPLSDKIESRHDLVFKLIGINEDFCRTKLYHNFKKDLIKSFVKNSKCGHILINGNYSTLCGNPIEMLYSSINKFDGKSMMDKESIYTTRFPFNKKLLASRSPHITMGNIWLPENKYNELIEKYMNPTNEIVYINSIRENVLQRLNGMDFDSDNFLLTDNAILIELAEKKYRNFLVPTSFVEAKKINRRYTKNELCDLDIKTSTNKIGEIVNLSQELNSLLWDNLSKNADYNYDELYLDICKLAVMSGIEIDKAKKEFDINTYKEMNDIRNKHSKYISKSNQKKRLKPKFFKTITIDNGFKLSENIKYQNYNTAMDYLQKIITQAYYNFYKDAQGEMLSLADIVDCDIEGVEWKQRSRLLSTVEYAKKDISEIWKNADMDWSTRRSETDLIKLDLVSRISSWKLNKSTKLNILKQADNDNFLFEILMSINGFINIFYKITRATNINIERAYRVYNLNLQKQG